LGRKKNREELLIRGKWKNERWGRREGNWNREGLREEES
jgi:hypothetical protein